MNFQRNSFVRNGEIHFLVTALKKSCAQQYYKKMTNYSTRATSNQLMNPKMLYFGG